MKRISSSDITTEAQLDAHLGKLAHLKRQRTRRQRRFEAFQDISVLAIVAALALLALYWNQLTQGQPRNVVAALTSARTALLYASVLSASSYALRRLYWYYTVGKHLDA